MRSILQAQGRNAHLPTSTHFSDEPNVLCYRRHVIPWCSHTHTQADRRSHWTQQPAGDLRSDAGQVTGARAVTVQLIPARLSVWPGVGSPMARLYQLLGKLSVVRGLNQPRPRLAEPRRVNLGSLASCFAGRVSSARFSPDSMSWKRPLASFLLLLIAILGRVL